MHKFIKKFVEPILYGACPYLFIYIIKDYITTARITKLAIYSLLVIATLSIFWVTGALLLAVIGEFKDD